MTARESQNKATVLRYFLESHNPPYNLDVIDETCTPEYGERLKRWLRMERSAFPDKQFTVDDAIAEGDRVVLRWSVHGTHQGDFWTPLGTAVPTGRRIHHSSTVTYRLEGGRIAEEWGQHDWLGTLQGLGMIAESTTAQNRALVLRYYEATHNQHDLSVIDETCEREYGEGRRRFFETAYSAFPDLRSVVEEVVAEGERVTIRETVRGTHKGAFSTPLGTIAPTGKPFEIRSALFYRVEGGKIVAEHGVIDWLAALKQVGVVAAQAVQSAR